MQAERLQNPKYVNWVKGALSLLYVKEGLVDVAEEHINKLHGVIENDVESKCKTAVSSRCTTCTEKSVKFTKKPHERGSNVYISCKSNVCNHWVDAILQHHEHLPRPNAEWDNCDPKLWPSQPWEVAKVFLPYGSRGQRNAMDSDCAGLLTLMLNCKIFSSVLSNKQILKDIKTYRNAIMHSGSLEAEDSELQSWTTAMIDLLEDNNCLNQLDCCKQAVEKIKQLRDNPLDMSLDSELEYRALMSRMTLLKTTVDNLQHDADKTKCVVRELTEEQQTYSENHVQLQQELKETRTTINQQKQESETLSKVISEFDVPGLKTMVCDISGQLQSLAEDNKEHIQRLADRIAVMEQNMTDIQTRLEMAETGISSLKKVTKVTGSKTEDEVVARVQHHLAALYNKYCQRVPIYPLKPSWKTRVEDLYVKPEMKVVDQNREMLEDGEHRNAEKKHGEKEKSSKVTNVKDIFVSDGKMFKDILISGEAGVGKTTLCEHIVSLWCKGFFEQVDELHDQVRFMQDYTLLFYISLREASKNSKICPYLEDIIVEQLHLPDVSVSNLLTENKCLVLLDGLDELSATGVCSSGRVGSRPIPRKRHSDQCTTLTTSRPWKLEKLTRELEGNIDRQVLITGLKTSAQEKLAENVIKLLNSKYNRDKHAYNFIRDLKSLNLKQYMATPVLLMQLLGMWYSGTPLGNSQCAIYSNIIEKQLQFAEEVRGLSETQYQVGNTKNAQLPTHFKDHLICQRYSRLLLKVSKLAYDCLFGENREELLVFDHRETNIFGLTDEEVVLCLRLGVLTQHKVFGEITEELKNISFIHKTHQEFFAAIYISTVKRSVLETSASQRNRSILSKLFRINVKDRHCFISSPLFVQIANDLDFALGMEKVFMFVCGLNPKLALVMSEIIANCVSRDERVLRYRDSLGKWQAPNAGLVEKVQNLVLAGAEEARNNHHADMKPRLDDLVVDNYRISNCVPCIDVSYAKSLFLWLPLPVEELSRFRSVQKLVLCNIDIERIRHIAVTNTQCLQVLHISGVDVSSLEESIFNLFAAPRLSAVALLGQIKMSHDQLRVLGKQLSLELLTEIRLSGLECTTHVSDQECKYLLMLDCSKLMRIELGWLNASSIFFYSTHLIECSIRNLHYHKAERMAVQILATAVNIEYIDIDQIKRSNLCILTSALPRYHRLRKIELRNITFDETVLMHFSPTMSCLELVQFGKYVQITTKTIRETLASLPSHRLQVELGGDSNYTIIVGDDAEELIQQLRDNHETVVKTDIVMPIKNGRLRIRNFTFSTTNINLEYVKKNDIKFERRRRTQDATTSKTTDRNQVTHTYTHTHTHTHTLLYNLEDGQHRSIC